MCPFVVEIVLLGDIFCLQLFFLFLSVTLQCLISIDLALVQCNFDFFLCIKVPIKWLKNCVFVSCRVRDLSEL